MIRTTSMFRSKRPTIYLPAEEMARIRREYDGIGYGPTPSIIKTYVTKNAIYRIESDLEIAQGGEFQRACNDLGIGNCGSWATVARRLIKYPYSRYSAATTLLEKTETAYVGGWIWSAPGVMLNRAEQYDMNKAYQWSLLNNVSWQSEYKIHEGYRRSADIVIAHVRYKREPFTVLPPPLSSGQSLVALSADDIERYNCYAVIPYYSVVFGPPDPDHVLRALRRIEHWPREWRNHVLRVAWGNFAMKSLCGSLWRDGAVVKEWRNKNTLYDPARAHIVSSRVKARIYDALPHTDGACRIYVDSITCRGSSIQTGIRPGEWRLNKVLENVKVRHGGRIHGIPAKATV